MDFLTAWTAVQVIALVAAILGTGGIVQLINACLQREKQKFETDAAELGNEILEQKIRTALYGENVDLRKDLNAAHDEIRAQRKQILQLEITLSDTIRQHQEEMVEVNIRLKMAEERLTNCEKAKTLLQVTLLGKADPPEGAPA